MIVSFWPRDLLSKHMEDKTFFSTTVFSCSNFSLELLERTDTSLAFAVFGSSGVQSFPVAVFNIGEGRSRDEYLLCYNRKSLYYVS